MITDFDAAGTHPDRFYDPQTNAVVSAGKMGFYYLNATINTNWEGGPVKTTWVFENSDGILMMQIKEDYKTMNEEFQETGQYNINRSFRFNESTNLFEEVKQEEVLEEK